MSKGTTWEKECSEGGDRASPNCSDSGQRRGIFRNVIIPNNSSFEIWAC